MEVSAALERLGGVGTTAQLVALSSRRRLQIALRRGEITRVGRGRYASADAISLAGVTSHLSAARHWGWPVKWPPEQPWVTVRRKRHLDAETRAVVNVSYADLTPDEIVDGVTSPLRTVLDCVRRLPFDEALAVADSALRAGAVTKAELVAAAARLRGRGATQARRVAAEATAKAANPFDSVLRALVLESSQLTVSPQLPVTARGAPGARTWTTRRDASSWKPTPGSSTRPRRRTPGTASATRRSCWPAGTSSGSPGSR